MVRRDLLGLLIGWVFLVSGCVGSADPGGLPQVDCQAPVNAFVDQVVVFDASRSSDPDGNLEFFAFDFGDGSPALRGKNSVVEHAYAEAGSFLTRVTVIDDVGNKFTELREIIIVERGSVPHLACHPERPFCPPFFLCDAEGRECLTDVDADGVPTEMDGDEPGCLEDAECPPQWSCSEDGLCVFSAT